MTTEAEIRMVVLVWRVRQDSTLQPDRYEREDIGEIR